MSRIILEEQVAAATPSANQIAIYPKAGGGLYWKNDAGDEFSAGPQLGTEQASTSGTSIDFTGIPAGVKRITVTLSGVSTSGNDNVIVQIGDSGGIETTGYLGAGVLFISATANNTTAFTASFGIHLTGAAATIRHGSMVLNLENSAAFRWAARGSFSQSDTNSSGVSSGVKALSAELDRVRITTASGSDTFDAGVINITYE